ncbi:uncharacterized protein B0P05DRAFT_579510 [Gilbertella persicaria]|uniref:uncharacterized protein n=1 Tax=Gilbertella persicaria TaxID=101096 RepID=UPI00221E3D69|nr:uncharacterized protein B0P05DRAFT_579510 [Gilbertella persicaria]KAI8078265.1 hypothetical protein B0P05DRAFT_579510 [Gilbertella persicaria]
MAQFLATIYDNSLGTELPEGVVQKRFQQTPAASAQAVNDAEAAMAYCRDEVLPELDVVDRDIVRPLLELSEIVKTINKTMVKRNHKLIDYDRHRLSIQKLNNKTERSFSEEKQIFKIQAQLDTATQDYNYLNDMLKTELPRFFEMKTAFFQPVFEHLFNMQARIYGIIYARCYELLNQNLETFQTHTMGIEEGFNWRKQQRDARAEYENLDLLKSGGKAWLAVSGGANNSKLTLQERRAIKAAEAQNDGHSPSPATYGSSSGGNIDPYYHQSPSSPPPPAYGNAGVTLDSTPMSYGKQSWQQPPVAVNNNNRPQKFVIALYDYVAQAEGDLSFRKDDKIEIIERTADTNDWWTGRLNGVTGVFPGNYVAEL